MTDITRRYPIPAPRVRQSFPFAGMGVGDSFSVAAPHGNQTLQVRSARVAMVKAAKKYGFKFTSRLEGAEVRIWRIA